MWMCTFMNICAYSHTCNKLDSLNPGFDMFDVALD